MLFYVSFPLRSAAGGSPSILVTQSYCVIEALFDPKRIFQKKLLLRMAVGFRSVLRDIRHTACVNPSR
jgi:hypothetical protein